MIILFVRFTFSIYRYKNLFFEKKKALLDGFTFSTFSFRLFAGSQFLVLGYICSTHTHT